MENMTNMMGNPEAEARVDLTNENVVNPIVTEAKPRENYQSMGSRIPADLKEDDIKVVLPTASAAQLSKATGHAVSPEALKIEREEQPTRIDKPEEPQEESMPRFMSPQQAEKAGIDLSKAEPIDIRAEVARRNQEQWQAAQAANDDALAKMLQGVMKSEEERNQRLDHTLNADEETRKRLLGDTPIAAATRKVTTEEERKRSDRQSRNPGIDPDELLPGYEEDEKPETPEAEDTEPDPDTDEYALFIKNLPIVSDKEPDKGYAVTRIREATVNIVKTNPDKTVNNLGNQAFQNAVANFKRDNFSKITVPLVNSGFMADVVGTGVVDLQNLYSMTDENMTPYDYQLERMAAIIRNVVGTNPRINPVQLRNSIHFQDYDMLAFAHICATLKTVETVANCTECGKPFHITSKPINLLLNMDELYEKRMAIESAANVEENSLMTSSRVISTESGMEVTLAHPSYAEMVRSIRGFQDFSADMTEANRIRFQNMIDILLMIRKIRLPNGIQSNNILQNYDALMLLNQSDFSLIQREVADMRKDIIVPRFGVREVECPHCHRPIKNIAYNNLDELLFFHLQVEAFLNMAATMKSKQSEPDGSKT